MQRLMRIAVKALVTANTPCEADGVALIADAHKAIPEGHEPREGGRVRTRRRRPIAGRLHITKGTVARCAIEVRGQERQQTRELLDQRQVKALH
nr:hypothetical protein [Nitrospirales bacterium]